MNVALLFILATQGEHVMLITPSDVTSDELRLSGLISARNLANYVT